MPSLPTLWRVLETVPDPEIPVVSVVELGIVRSLEWDAADPSTLVVLRDADIFGLPGDRGHRVDDPRRVDGGRRAARAPRDAARAGVDDRLDRPASAGEAARIRYRTARGGANPAQRAIDISGLRSPRRAAAIVACPRCGSERTRLMSQFGSTACKAQYRCDTCLEPFDYFKPTEAMSKFHPLTSERSSARRATPWRSRSRCPPSSRRRSASKRASTSPCARRSTGRTSVARTRYARRCRTARCASPSRRALAACSRPGPANRWPPAIAST